MASPSKRDAWPLPQRWLHVWVKLDRSHLAPMPGLVLTWRRGTGSWDAWVVWVDEARGVRQGWVHAHQLRPAESDPNVWNDRLAQQPKQV